MGVIQNKGRDQESGEESGIKERKKNWKWRQIKGGMRNNEGTAVRKEIKIQLRYQVITTFS